MSDDLFSRWARRKEAVAREEIVETEDVEPDEAELEQNRIAAEAVDLDGLNAESDLSVFLRRGVPDLIRNQALSAVWRSNPVFANLDGLIDHGEDFNDPDMIMESFKSAWKIGEGYLRAAVEPVDPVDETSPDATGAETPPPAVTHSPAPENPEIDLAEDATEPEPSPVKIPLRQRHGI